jgi:putative transcription factor
MEVQKESCHICGEPAVSKSLIEGAKVPVCNGCRGYGRELESVSPEGVRLTQLATGGTRLPEFSVKPGYGEVVRRAREKEGYTRELLAKKLFINEGELSKIESEKLVPGELVARKLERALSITLLEQAGEQARASQAPRSPGGGVVLGEVADVS